MWLKILNSFLFLSIVSLMLFTGCENKSDTGELVVYSARIEELIKPVFDEYTKQTGIKVKYITDKEGPLLQKLKAEGENTPADIFLTVDAGNLWQASNEDIFVPVNSEILEQNIPPHLRDPENRWFGFSERVRTIVYNTGKVNPDQLSTYEALGDSEWKGKLGLRTSKKVYNQSLVAMLIEEHGVDKTEAIVKSWVDNLATDPFADDTSLLEAVAAGQCDVGIVNTYYYGRLLKKTPDLPVKLFWANQTNGGVHVNVSGAGIIKYSKNKDEAIKFLEWLSSGDAQKMFAGLNLEYPVNPSVEPDPLVASWGSFKPNLINVSKAGELQTEAIKLMDRAGYK